jgi:hypothetical protein
VQECLEGILGRRLADPDPRARARGHAELGRNPHHDLDLLVRDRDVRALHGEAVRRLDHRAVALDRGHRLDPERVRLAVGGEQAAIEPGQKPELRQLLGKTPPLFPGLVAEAGRLPTRRWVEVEPEAMAYHPLNNVPVTIWILLLLPMALAIAFAGARIGGFLLGLSRLIRRLHAQAPEIPDAQALLSALSLVANDDHALLLVVGNLTALVPICVFGASLIALHRRGVWFPTLYLAGLLLNMVLFDAEELVLQIRTIGAAGRSVPDLIGDSAVIYGFYLALCLGGWIWIAQSRRLNLIVRHCVRADDPLLASDEAPPDILRQRTIAQTSLAFARLPPSAQNDVIKLILEEVKAPGADAAGTGVKSKR